MIDDFRGKYMWLSNFYLAPVRAFGILFPATEHAYMAAKTLDHQERLMMAEMTAPDVKAYGKTITIRADWDIIRVPLMEELNLQKFTKHERLGKRLLATEDQELIEGNTWGDTFWGVCNGVGENNLGKIHMRNRLKLRERANRSIEEYLSNMDNPPWI